MHIHSLQALAAVGRLWRQGLLQSTICVVLPALGQPEEGPLCQPEYWCDASTRSLDVFAALIGGLHVAAQDDTIGGRSRAGGGRGGAGWIARADPGRSNQR